VLIGLAPESLVSLAKDAAAIVFDVANYRHSVLGGSP
jgi:hypothetical protein